MALPTTFLEQLTRDLEVSFIGENTPFGDEITRTDLSGATTTLRAQFDFQVGAVDDKERAVFLVSNAVDWQRGDYVTHQGLRWTVIDVRPDGLVAFELRCDKPEITP